MREFALRRDIIVHGLHDIGLPCVEPRGAIYAFPSVRETGLSSAAFAERLLLEKKVAVVPGNAFGASGEGYVRIAYTAPAPQLEEALERIQHFVRQRDVLFRLGALKHFYPDAKCATLRLPSIRWHEFSAVLLFCGCSWG